MSKIKTVIIEGDLIDSNGWHILLPLKELLESLDLEHIEELCIDWDIATGKLVPILLNMNGDPTLCTESISQQRLDTRWVDMWGDHDTLSFKYLNETLYICTGHTTPKITFDENMTMLDVPAVRDQLVELCALARKELINEFEFKWITHANFKTDIEGSEHLEHFIKAMELPTEWEHGTPYKVTIVYNRNTIEVGVVDDDLKRIKTCPILRTKFFHRLKCQVDRMMDNLKILGVNDIDLIWNTRDGKIMVNSISLNTDDIYTDTRVMQAQAILNMPLDSNWPEDFPEKVNITMNPNIIHLTAI